MASTSLSGIVFTFQFLCIFIVLMYYCVVYREFLWPISISNGFILQIFWNLLDGELKPKCNKILSVIELWTHCKQGSKTLSEWLTYVYNLVEICDYAYSKDTIIRDVIIFGCNSNKAKEKIVQQGEKISLNRIIEILWREDFCKAGTARNTYYCAEDPLCIL